MSWTQWGGSSERFGHADWDALRGQGKTNREILDWLNNNYGTLAGNNKPGQGGLYDELSSAVFKDQQSMYTNKLNDVKSSFESQLADFTKQLSAYKSSYNQKSSVNPTSDAATTVGANSNQLGLGVNKKGMSTGVGSKNKLKINSVQI